MRELSRYQCWYGRDEPPVEMRELRAGPLAAQLEGTDLRYVRLGDTEIVRRLFVAVRDAAWGTIPPQISDLTIDEAPGSFEISFDAFHESGGLCYRWRGELTGHEDGTLQCRMDGRAVSDCRYNRIGFCVLHPRENAGRPYRARTPDGEIEGTLPETIGQQRFAEGTLWPLFPSYDLLEIEVKDGLRARFEFTGDLFEMEDQRNWTDASFKTYSTPITLGWPHDAPAGEAIEQVVRIACEGRMPAATSAPDLNRIELGEPTQGGLPALGLGLASHREPLSEREAELIGRLGPEHVRADLNLDEDWQQRLAAAAETALSLGAALELALFLGENAEGQLDELASWLGRRQDRIDRVLVFERGKVVSGSPLVGLARSRLAAVARGAWFAAGTDQWFADLNRERPDLDGADAVAYSINATVHADDDISVRETPPAQGDTVRSAASLFGLPVVVSPVTIRPRSWPFGELEGHAGLPFQVDPRQCALFGAAWTAASLKHLAEAGAASITYFETTGWRGVMEREAPSSPSDAFPSSPGAVFPLYHVLADAAEWRRNHALVVSSRSSDPLAVDALAVRTGRGRSLLVCNLTPEVQDCSLGHDGRHATMRVLDEESAGRGGEDPEQFGAGRGAAARGDSMRLVFELPPYAVARIDLE